MYTEKLLELRKEIEDYIMSVLLLRGTPYELCEPFDDFMDATEMGIQDMPRTTNWRDLDSDLNETGYIYAIKEGGICEVCLFEGNDFELTLGELELEVLVELTDLIYSLENPTEDEEEDI